MDSDVTPITVSMIEALRHKVVGVIVADGAPLVRSRIHYDGPDPLNTGEQVVVIDRALGRAGHRSTRESRRR